jgi:PAS domain S-box-containing protein
MLQPQDVFLAPIEAQARNAFLLALAIVSVAVVAAIGVARLLTGPIVRLTELARRVAEGDLSAKVDVSSNDEIGVLASAFNLMTAKLKKTHDGLRRSEEDYRGIYENALEGIWRISMDGRALSANPAMAEILGYGSPSDLVANVTDIGRQVYVDPEQRDTVILADLARRPVIGREVEFYRRDRRRIWISFSGRLVRSKTGRPLFIESFVTEITERKQMETALRESEQRFRDFARTSSHAAPIRRTSSASCAGSWRPMSRTRPTSGRRIS